MKRVSLLVGLILISLFIVACAATPTVAPTQPPKPTAAPPPTAVPKPTDAPKATEAPKPTVASTAAPKSVGLGLPGKMAGKSWDDILAAAKGQTVNWWMWGGNPAINNWVKGWLTAELKKRYDINLKQVPVATAQEYINQVMGEKSAGNNDNGAVDLVWVNAENFRTMKQANLLYGPFPEKLPSAKFVTWDDTKITDAGFPTDGYEMPLWTCHALFAYDSAKVPKPPTTWDELFKWIKDNPGQFTHPVSSDFVGSYFIRQACMNATGGYKQYLGAFEQTLFNKNFSTCWDKLNEIKGSFWRNGKTYPEASPAMYGLLGQGEIAIAPCTCQNCVQSRIDTGQFPKTARTLIIRGATETACNFAAIPYNSPHLAAALVTADLLMSPDGQYTAAVEHRQFPVIDVALLSPEWQAKFKALDYGPGFLPVNVLQADAVPMIPSSWWVPIEDGWRKNVQQK